jgi:hypothetical protein
MKTVSVTIMEVPGHGWVWKEIGRTYKTAHGAFQAVLRDGQKFNQTVAHVVTWEPATPAGTIIVRSITS